MFRRFLSTGIILFFGSMMMASVPSTGLAIQQSPEGEPPLRLEEAISAALTHNYGLRISRIEVDKAENSATRGNAGQYPNISLSGQLSGSYTRLDVTPGSLIPLPGDGESDGPASRSFDGVRGSQAEAGIAAEYVIYDGFQGRLRYALLETGAASARLEQRAAMEDTILEITRRYLTLAGLQQQLELRALTLEQSRERYRRTEAQREYGQAAEQQRLQALADLSTDSTEYRRLELQYDQAFREMNAAIGWEERTTKQVQTSLEVPSQENETLPQSRISPDSYAEKLEQLLSENTALSLREQGVAAAELEQKLRQAARMPRVSARAQYGYSYEEVSQGLFERQDRLGSSGSISLQVPIFTGGQRRTAAQNAEASRRQAALQYDDTRRQLRSRFENTWQEIRHLEEELRRENTTIGTYERNYERARSAFREGLITGVELRAAQLALQQARLRYVDTAYNLRLSETVLHYLAGELLQETS
jgi:outer membrane protein TolC